MISDVVDSQCTQFKSMFIFDTFCLSKGGWFVRAESVMRLVFPGRSPGLRCCCPGLKRETETKRLGDQDTGTLNFTDFLTDVGPIWQAKNSSRTQKIIMDDTTKMRSLAVCKG